MREAAAGQSLEPEKLIVWLSEHGYNRLDQVEVPGDFAVRGGIIDVYLPGEFDAGGGAGRPDRPHRFLRRPDRVDQAVRPRHAGLAEKLESVRLIDLKGQLPDDAGLGQPVRAICPTRRSSCSGRRWKSPSRPRAISIACRR